MDHNNHADSECISKCERNRAYFKQESPYVCKFNVSNGTRLVDPNSLIECFSDEYFKVI